MSQPYRLFGSELSPYSVKVRSVLRYKGIDHQWIVRTPAHHDEFRRYAKLPLVPLLVTPADQGLQDSTPIVMALEAEHPTPAILPPHQPLKFLSLLLEEFADEWGNKWMFHYRWAREVDQLSAAQRIAESMLQGAADESQIAATAAQIRERMVNRVWFVGSSPQTAPQIEASFRDSVELLDRHLVARPYLFGVRPSLADFGLWAQLYECWSDPTTHGILATAAPNMVSWIERLLSPRATSEDADPLHGWEEYEALRPTLEPFLETQVGARFLPWSVANAAALVRGEEEFTVELASGAWTQKPQKYHAKSLVALQRQFAEMPTDQALERLLERTGCLKYLRRST
jgi:glutathione S-transferase